jgi:hypothetical protein
VAAGGFAVAAIVVLSAVALARAPLPVVDTRDPAAARDLVTLMRAGERSNWIASYAFTRTLANGRTLRENRREGRSSSLHVLIGGSVMTIEQGDRSYDCNLVADRSGCKESTIGATLPASEVLRVAVSVGAYDVVRRPDVTIAGIRARCFRVLATGRGGLPDLGVETDQCLSSDGISLRQLVVRPPGTVDTEVATEVKRPATTADIDALAASFAPNPVSAQR